MKLRNLTLSVKANTRDYFVEWFTEDDGDTSPYTEIVVHVTTVTRNNCTATEKFIFSNSDIPIPIQNRWGLEQWFFEYFAYRYADLYSEGDPCKRAAILYDLGNYTPELKQQNSAYSLDDAKVVDPGDYYAVINNDPFSIANFDTYESAEQWANESMYRSDVIEVGALVKPYTIFTVKGVGYSGLNYPY